MRIFLTKIIPTILILLVVSACQVETEDLPQIFPEAEITATHIATFEVEGMMCEKGCGATIRKGLYETGGVSKVSVSFNEKQPTNEISVFFDIDKISTSDLIDVIDNVANKRYSAKLKRVSESKIVSSSPKPENKLKKHTAKESSPMVNAEIPTSRIPFISLTKLLNRLVN